MVFASAHHEGRILAGEISECSKFDFLSVFVFSASVLPVHSSSYAYPSKPRFLEASQVDTAVRVLCLAVSVAAAFVDDLVANPTVPAVLHSSV